MKTLAISKKPSKTKRRRKVGVLFGFNLSDKSEVGYFGKDLKIAKERADAREFPLKGKKSDGFATPQKWCQFINSDEDLSNGYKFHVVKVYAIES